MNIPNIGGIVKVGKTFLMAKRPEIMLGTSVVAAISAAVLGAKGGWEARGIVEQRELELGRQTDVKEKIQLTWLCYIPATAAVSTSIAATCGLHYVHIKDKKALTLAAMAAVEEANDSLKQYAEDVDAAMTPAQREKVNEKMREKAETEGGAFVNGDGMVVEKYLVRDNWTGRDIYSSKVDIEDAVNHCNASISEGADIELNTFYGLAGFDPIEKGDELGWSGELIKLKWGSDTRKDDRPVVTFGFRTPPTLGFDRRR